MSPVRIEEIGPNDANASLSLGATDQWVSGKALSVAISADGQRAYLGGHSGVWRSNDGGANWTHSEAPQPTPGQPVTGALTSPNVYDLAISPASNDIVFAATGDDARSPDRSGVYRSTDGAKTWALVAPAPQTGNLFVVSQLAIAPDNPSLVYAAAGASLLFSSTGGDHWAPLTLTPFNIGDRVWHVATGRMSGAERWVYAVGTRVWFSRDGGDTWSQDMVAASHNLTLGATRFGGSSGARALAVHPTNPQIVFLTRTDFSIWNGDYINLPLTQFWTQLAPTPVIPNGPTDSGANFIVPHVTPDNQFFLISSDRRTVCIAQNLPFGTSDWTRIEDGNCHVDPHSLALTPDFFPAIASGSPKSRGRAILVNDGGAVFTTDGGRSWSHGKGLRTLNAANFAVAPRGANAAPTLFFGGGDNSGFSSADGGHSWSTQDYDGGDNDCSFADPMQPTRALVFAPRQEGPNEIFREIFLYVSGGSGPPNVGWGTGDRRQIPGPLNLPPATPTSKKVAGWNAVSSFVNFGFRPLVLTIAGQEAPIPGGDVMIVRFTPNAAFLMRTWKLADISSAGDWVSSATADGPGVKSFQVGPQLPVNNSGAVQASGGHGGTVFYFSDPVHFDFDEVNNPGGMRLWKWTAGMSEWALIVPHRTVTLPTRRGVGVIGLPQGPQKARRILRRSLPAQSHLRAGGRPCLSFGRRRVGVGRGHAARKAIDPKRRLFVRRVAGRQSGRGVAARHAVRSPSSRDAVRRRAGRKSSRPSTERTGRRSLSRKQSACVRPASSTTFALVRARSTFRLSTAEFSGLAPFRPTGIFRSTACRRRPGSSRFCVCMRSARALDLRTTFWTRRSSSCWTASRKKPSASNCATGANCRTPRANSSFFATPSTPIGGSVWNSFEPVVGQDRSSG